MKKYITRLSRIIFLILFICITFIPSSSHASNTSLEYYNLVQSLQKLINDFSKYLSANKIDKAPQNAFLAQLTPPACSTVCSGLMGYWTFDEGSGTSATDSSGNGNGTLGNGATWAGGIVGSGALSLDGADDFVVLPGGVAQIGSGDFSVSAWEYYKGGSNYQSIVTSKASGPNGTKTGYALMVVNSGSVGFQVDKGPDSYNFITAPITSTGWHHIVGTFTQGSSMKIYVDGNYVTQKITGIPSGTLNGSNPVRIGDFANFSAGDNRVSIPFNGYIDDVRIYNRALGDSEVSQLYTMGGGVVSPPAVVTGSCSSTVNQCSVGTLSDTTDSSTQYLWNCVGTGGGSTANCSSNIPQTAVVGVCGSTLNSCTAGTFSDTTDSSTQYLWNCVGTNSSRVNCSSNIATVQNDTTPPTVTNTTSSSFGAGTTQITMSVATNEASTCKYSTTPNIPYDSMTNTFSTTGNTSHSTTITGLSNGTSYTRYVRCKDTAGNKTNSDKVVSFQINNPVQINNVNVGATTLSSVLSTMNSTGRPWVFLGDSITDQQIYSVYMEAYFQLRYPGRNLHFRGEGRGGSWMPDVMLNHPHQSPLEAKDTDRYGRNVYAWKPSVVSVMFSSNKGPTAEAWNTQLRELVSDYVIGKSNAIPVLLTSIPANTFSNTTEHQYSDKLNAFGVERGYLFADAFDYLDSIWGANRASKTITINGGIPPSDTGHQNQASGLGFAYALLSDLGAPSDVSSATINATNGTLTSQSSEAHVTNISKTTLGVDFNRKDDRFPMAFDDEARTIFQIMPQIYDLNKYMLTVTGLEANTNYDVWIDGENSATVNSATLDSGWNMTSMIKGPIYRQLKNVLDKIRLKEGVALTTTNNSLYARTDDGTNTHWTGVQRYKSNAGTYYGLGAREGDLWQALSGGTYGGRRDGDVISYVNGLDNNIYTAVQALTSATRTFSLRKSGSSSIDSTLPTVSITAPTNGSTVSGATVTVSASASDNISIAGVQFKLDGVSLGTEDTVSPYSIPWNASTLSGTHILTALARDISGNTASSSVSVTVNNQSDTTSPTITNTTLSTFALGTTQVTMSVTTDKLATCKYSTTPNIPYDSMTSTFSTTGGTSHLTTITGLSNGTSYTRYVRCKDAAENKTTSDTVISFQVGTNSLKQNYLNALTQALHAYKNIAVKLEHPNGSTYIGWAKSRTVDGLSPIVYGGNHGVSVLEPIIDLDTQATGETGIIYAYIKAYELTKNKFFLRTAESAGETLLSIANENNNSGWEVDHTIGKYAAKVDNNIHSSGWINCNAWNSKCNPSFFFQNRTSLDDGVSNSVAITLIRLYEASGKTKYLDAVKNFAQSLIDLKNVRTNGQIGVSTLNSIFQDTVYSSTPLHKISINGKILLILNMDSKINISQVEYANFHYLINESDINALNLTSSKKQQLLDLYAQTHNTLYPYANGGIPQILPIEKAYYASESAWVRLCNNYFINNPSSPFNNTCPGVRYQAHKTLNDGPIQDSIQMMILLYDKTGDQKYLNNAELQADYLVARQQKYQMAWGPQYSVIDDSQAWGRDMEPPAISLDLTTSVIDSLLSVYSKTSDSARKTRIANSIKSAMIWEKSLTPDEVTSNGSNFYYKYFAFRNPYTQYATLGTPTFSDNYTAYFGSSNSSKQGCCWANILGEHSVKILTSQLLDVNNNLTLDKYFNYTQTNNRPYYDPNSVLGMGYTNPATAYANLNKANGFWESALSYGGVNRKQSSAFSVTANSLGLIDGIKTAQGTLADSDGDGYSDVVETTAGKDAYDSESYPGSIPHEPESYPDYVSACGNGVVDPGETSANCSADVISTQDTTKPTASITSPTNNSTISGSVNLSANAFDNVGVVVVQLKLDGAIIAELTTPSPANTYSGAWNTIGVSNGTHSLTATARDLAGNTTISATVTITINNTTGVAPSVGNNTGGSSINTGGVNTTPNTVASSNNNNVVGSSNVNNVSSSPTGSFTPTVKQISVTNTSTNTIPTSSTQTFFNTLSIGSTGADVKTLQIFLNNKGYTVAITGAGSKGNETSYFGNATIVALKKLQIANKLKATGILDEATRKYINSLAINTAIPTTITPEKSALLASLQKQLGQLIILLKEAMIREGMSTVTTPAPTPVYTPTSAPSTSSNLLFPTNLWVNMQSPDIKRLQVWLNTHGFVIATEGPGSPGNESDRFGNATIAALKKFQASVGVPQSGGLDQATRAKIF